MATPTLPSAPELLKRLQRRAKKSLGQNFLVDESVLMHIAAAACSGRPEAVLEIGPGPGSLTQALLRRGVHVHAIEKDTELVAFLRKELPGAQLTVSEADVLSAPWPDLGSEGVAVGNLPYNISTQVFFSALERIDTYATLIFMFQREVAHRFVAEPRTKAYGVLSLIGQYFYRPHLVLNVPPGAFRPVPKVHSAVVRFVRRDERELEPALEGDFRAVVKAGFSQRRKTLSNSVSGVFGLSKPVVSQALVEAHINPRARAEELSVSEFCALTRVLVQRRQDTPASSP